MGQVPCLAKAGPVYNSDFPAHMHYQRTLMVKIEQAQFVVDWNLRHSSLLMRQVAWNLSRPVRYVCHSCYK
jgi:hypothetical protein